MERRLLKKGDTIQCSDKKDALKCAKSLDQLGVKWDFDFSKEPKILLIITEDEKEQLI